MELCLALMGEFGCTHNRCHKKINSSILDYGSSSYFNLYFNFCLQLKLKPLQVPGTIRVQPEAQGAYG